MDIANQKKPWDLDTVAEIIGDLFCFDLILEIKRRMKNDEAKAYVSNFLRILAPIYVHEIANALDRLGIISKGKLLGATMSKRVNAERQLSTHKTIVNSSEAIKVLTEMGITFDHKVYDINIVATKGMLYDLNFETQVAPMNDLDFWNFLFGIPHVMLTAAFSAVSPDFNFRDIYKNNNDQLDSIANRMDNALSFTRYSYSSRKLFQHSENLSVPDRVLILYRYRMITSVNVLSDLIPSFHATMGDRRIVDMDFFFKKYRALIITMLGDELRQLNTPFSILIKAGLIK